MEFNSLAKLIRKKLTQKMQNPLQWANYKMNVTKCKETQQLLYHLLEITKF